MPMRATTVRFSEDLWRLLEREAGDQGVSAAQFIRDATILRAAVLAERRGDRETRLTIEDIAAGALRPAGRGPPAGVPGGPAPPRPQAARAPRPLGAPPGPAPPPPAPPGPQGP